MGFYVTTIDVRMISDLAEVPSDDPKQFPYGNKFLRKVRKCNATNRLGAHGETAGLRYRLTGGYSIGELRAAQRDPILALQAFFEGHDIPVDYWDRLINEAKEIGYRYHDLVYSSGASEYAAAEGFLKENSLSNIRNFGLDNALAELFVNSVVDFNKARFNLQEYEKLHNECDAFVERFLTEHKINPDVGVNGYQPMAPCSLSRRAMLEDIAAEISMVVLGYMPHIHGKATHGKVDELDFVAEVKKLGIAPNAAQAFVAGAIDLAQRSKAVRGVGASR